MNNIDVSLIPVEDLIKELVRRHDGIIIAGIKFTTQHNYVLTRHWSGNHFVCLGILEDAKHQINRKGEDSFTPDK